MIKPIIRYTLGTLILLFYNLFKYPFSRKSRHKLSASYLALRYPFYGVRNVELNALLTNNELGVTLFPLKSNKHNVTEFELLSICALIKDKQVKKIFEIGTFDGRTTRSMALNTSDDGFIYTLNLPSNTDSVHLSTGLVDIQLASQVISGVRFLKSTENAKIEQLWGDSAVFNFTPYYNNIDLVFIDGAHSCEYVESDTSVALKMVKSSGGLIVWHDAHLFGVVKFLKMWIQKNNYPLYFIKGTSLAIAEIKNGLPIEMKVE